MAKVQPWWQITKTDENAFKLDVHFQGAGQPRRLLLLTDLHWDSAHCELPRLKAVLDEAKAIGAPVFSFGDTWDAMQGKWDPRSSTDAMRAEFLGGNYLDLLVTEFTKWFQPWKESLALITYGNHETSILKRHQVDLLQRAVGDLRRDGSPVLAGPYVGFVVVANRFPGKHLAPPIKVHFHHGAGGGAEVTRGFIDHNRTRSMYSDFDCHISGHIHRRNMDENIITRVTSQGKVQKRRQLFLRSSCWKDESTSGWHVQQGRAARPIGGWWLELIPSKSHSGGYMVDMRPIPT